MNQLSRIRGTAAIVGLFSIAGLAQANPTFEPFVNVTNSVAADGFNNLTASRITAATPSAANAGKNIRTGIAGNVDLAPADGGAIFTRTSGTAYPASSGLYEWGGPRSTFEFNVASASAGINQIVFQSFVNISESGGVWGLLSADNLPRLSFNGGAQFLLASVFTAVPAAGGLDMEGNPQVVNPDNKSYATFTWDLAGLGVNTPVVSFKLSFATDAHANGLAFQIDQVVGVTPVPEPETYALMLAGIGALAWVARRRKGSNLA